MVRKKEVEARVFYEDESLVCPTCGTLSLTFSDDRLRYFKVVTASCLCDIMSFSSTVAYERIDEYEGDIIKINAILLCRNLIKKRREDKTTSLSFEELIKKMSEEKIDRQPKIHSRIMIRQKPETYQDWFNNLEI